MLGPYGTDFSVKSRFRFQYLGSGSYCWIQGFQGIICISRILVQNQAKPKVLVFEPKLTGTLTAQNCRYQSTKVSVHSVFPVLAQHYYLKFQLYLYHDLHFEHKFLTEPISLAKYYSSDVRVLQYLC